VEHVYRERKRERERERERGERKGEREREIKCALLFPFCRILFVTRTTLEGFIGAGLPVDPLSFSHDNRARLFPFFCATHSVVLNPID